MNPDDTTDKVSEVVEAEVVASEPTTQGSADILINMEAMIKNYISAIEKQADESKKLKEMLEDIFDNDPTYKDHKDKSKEAAKVLAGTKAQILKRPQAADLSDKIKNIKNEQKENQDALSDYLQEYQRLSGATEIETEDGKLHQIVYTARLVRK